MTNQFLLFLIVKYTFLSLKKIPETYYGGEFETEADYKDPFVRDLINEKGFSIMPLIEYSYDTINYDLKSSVTITSFF